MSALMIVLSTFWGIPMGVWVLLGTITSGLSLQAGTKFFNRRIETRDDRKDYRDEIKDLNERVDRLEEQVTQWRDRYYAEQNHTARLENFIIKDGHEPPERKN